MDKYAVFGNPIAQSKSPAIHAKFAQATRQKLDYTAILAPVDQFESSLDSFFADLDNKGCNVTLPFKERAAAWVDELSDAARIAGAVNTISRSGAGKLVGDNTDGKGLVLDILSQNVDLKGKRILIIGAGGAARGALLPLYHQQPHSITIVNRTLSKAKVLAQIIESDVITACDYDKLNQQNVFFDIIINSTSASLSGELPPLSDDIISSSTYIYDMVYGEEPTVFMKHAIKLGVKKVSDGLGMLVGQAAEAFSIWRGVKPDITSVLAEMRDRL